MNKSKASKEVAMFHETKKNIVSILVTGVLFFSGPAAAETYYVAPDGDDGHPGTEAEPWLTIQKAADTMVAGDTTIVKAGTYTESGNTNRAMITPAGSGEPGSLVTFRADPGDAVIIDGRGGRQFAFELNGLDYIRIEGFEITGITGHGILVSWDSEHGFGIEIVGNDIHGCGTGSPDTAAVYYRFSRHGLIENNRLHHNGGDGITMEVTDGIAIRNNAIYENAVDGIKGGGSGAIIIENNTIHDMTSGEYHGDCIQYMGNEAVIRNNVFYNCTQDIYVDTYSDPAGSSPRGDFYIYNNIVYNPDPGPDGTEGYYNGISIDQRYNSINALYVFNNTIVNQNSGHGGFGNGTTVEYKIGTLMIMNNVFLNSVNGVNFENAGTTELDYNLYYNEFRDWYLPGFVGLDEFRAGNPEYEVHGMNLDPLLALELTSTNPVTDPDFTLQSGSPAIDAGAALSAYFTADIAGTPRPQGAGWDIGAYEYAEPRPCADLGGACCDEGLACEGGVMAVSTDCGARCCLGGICTAPSDPAGDGAAETVEDGVDGIGPDVIPDLRPDTAGDAGADGEQEGEGGGEGCGCALVL
jgi:hypothetical protein